MATEIAQTRNEMNESDKKHMGMSKYKLLKKVRTIFEQRTSFSSSLAADIDRILKLPVEHKAKPPAPPAPEPKQPAP